MAVPVHIPRLNNNDDTVKIAQIPKAVGDSVRAGDIVFEVETEKATIAIEAESNGYVLALNFAVGAEAPVGAVAGWIGAAPDEAIPDGNAQAAQILTGSDGMTAKARSLLRRHNLSAELIPLSGTRLTAADVENYLAANPAAAKAPPPVATGAADLPASAAFAPLTPIERGMLAAVDWQRHHAAAAYLEIEYDSRPWEAVAAAYALKHRLLVSPVLALMAYRLVRLAADHNSNGSLTDESKPRRIRYDQVNLGFTVQAGEVLYLCVVEAADRMDEAAFVIRLLDLQRRAMGHKLLPSEMRGATIAFTSMARWGVRRHIPILAPHTCFMLAHAAKPVDGGPEILGATYDHRLLSGFDAVRLLKKVAKPHARNITAEELS